MLGVGAPVGLAGLCSSLRGQEKPKTLRKPAKKPKPSSPLLAKMVRSGAALSASAAVRVRTRTSKSMPKSAKKRKKSPSLLVLPKPARKSKPSPSKRQGPRSRGSRWFCRSPGHCPCPELLFRRARSQPPPNRRKRSTGKRPREAREPPAHLQRHRRQLQPGLSVRGAWIKAEVATRDLQR